MRIARGGDVAAHKRTKSAVEVAQRTVATGEEDNAPFKLVREVSRTRRRMETTDKEDPRHAGHSGYAHRVLAMNDFRHWLVVADSEDGDVAEGKRGFAGDQGGPRPLWVPLDPITSAAPIFALRLRCG